jgi:predicted adenylyl cyclase CyaB
MASPLISKDNSSLPLPPQKSIRNLEIKARVTDMPQLQSIVERIAGKPAEVLDQEDTYFKITSGRLKLRITGGAGGQLVYYQRSNEPGTPRCSDYRIATIADAHPLREVLSEALGVVGIVRKQRAVYLVGRTRIHLDQVQGQGNFVELEYVYKDPVAALADYDLTEEGEAWKEVEDLMRQMGIERRDLIGNSYIDL